MIVIPAIDLHGGKCVRMKQGDLSSERVYDDDPVERARAFVGAGATRLHVVDLDSAFGSGENFEAIARICRAVDVPVQTGGGIRTLEHAQARLANGASNVILGTLLVEDERVARNIIHYLGDKVIAGIDARGREVSIRGWAEGSPVDRDALVKRVSTWGVGRIVFTEILRDGMGEGYDHDALRAVADIANLPVTASGGAHNIVDLQALKNKAPKNVDSCIVGSALYEGTIVLSDAIAAVG